MTNRHQAAGDFLNELMIGGDDSSSTVMDNAIAIVGMSGRFPGADSVNALWDNLLDGVESITRFSDEQLLAAGVSRTTVDNPRYVKARGIIDRPEYFDAGFFGYTPREAELLDPQQRIMLETTWHLFEDAGYDPADYPGRVGVFAGASYSPYLFTHLAQNRSLLDIVGLYQMVLSNSRDYVATRVAHKLNLKGPAITVQTACSTSLVAVHLACQSLAMGESDMAIAGGVNVCPPFHSGYLYRAGGIHSSDGHCRAFDADAGGTVSGQGIGLVLLKRLYDAIDDGDTIRAVVLGTATNNDGSDKIGFTAPSIDGQAEAIREALAVAKVDPAMIGYVEAHGTGTALGDPIEIAALTQAYRQKTDRTGYCAIGSLKTNIGHLDAASGVAGLIKGALTLYHARIPPMLHFKAPNPKLELDTTPFRVNTTAEEWPRGHEPRRAAVSSLGLGGTNAHVILEEAPPRRGGPSRARQLVLLSARTSSTLDTMTTDLAKRLADDRSISLADTCYTLHRGRRRFAHRRMLVCRDREDAARALAEVDPERVLTQHGDAIQGGPPIVTFMIPGHDSRFRQVARGLYENEKVFRDNLDKCAELLAPVADGDIRKLMYPRTATDSTEQPRSLEIEAGILFSLRYALARQWMALGVVPQGLIGHSMGEYVVACLSEVFSLDDALRLVTARGRLFAQTVPGRALAVPMSSDDIQPFLNDKLSVATINSDVACVVSGLPDAIEALSNTLVERDVSCQLLELELAPHSFTLDPILPAFAHVVEQVSLCPPQIPFISCVTGTWITKEQATSVDYWVQHLRQPVRFADGIATLLDDRRRIFLEVGPGHTLGRFVRKNSAYTRDTVVLGSLPHKPSEQFTGDDDIESMLHALGRLWLSGHNVDWAGFYTRERRLRIPLPGYPFDRQRYWVDEYRGKSGVTLSQNVESNTKAADNSATPTMSASPARTPGADVVLPRNSIEQTIARIWAQSLGVATVGVFDDFFELGGDSLVAIRTIERVSDAFDVSLPPSTLVHSPTVAAFARVIARNLDEPAPGDDNRSLETARAWSPAVQIQRGTATHPLFLSHAAGGGIYFYRLLAKAMGNAPWVYGLEARGLRDPAAAHETLAEIADCHLQAITALQPEGPYFLGGSSMGGAIAYEVAQALTARGANVALVVMMDTPGVGQMPRVSPDQAHRLVELFGDAIPIDVDDLRALDEREQIALTLERARAVPDPTTIASSVFPLARGDAEAVRRALGDVTVEQVQRLLEVFSRNVQVFRAHSAQPYAGRVSFFRARDRRAGDPAHPERAWIDLAQGGIDIDIVPGNHNTMMHPPNVADLARKLAARLRAVGLDI